jgi:hypothetical protein
VFSLRLRFTASPTSISYSRLLTETRRIYDRCHRLQVAPSRHLLERSDFNARGSPAPSTRSRRGSACKATAAFTAGAEVRQFLAPSRLSLSPFAHARMFPARPSDRMVERFNAPDLSLWAPTVLLEALLQVCLPPVERLLVRCCAAEVQVQHGSAHISRHLSPPGGRQKLLRRRSPGRAGVPRFGSRSGTWAHRRHTARFTIAGPRVCGVSPGGGPRRRAFSVLNTSGTEGSRYFRVIPEQSD